MNTLSKVLVVFCVILSAVAYASLSNTYSGTVSSQASNVPVSVATSADGKIVYVGKEGQVFKSSDGGDNWEVVR